jgi:hypothetical protein
MHVRDLYLGSVGSFYVRVLNPLHVAEAPRRWSEFARSEHDPWVEWFQIVAEGTLPPDTVEPVMGSVDPDVAGTLITVLRGHTSSPQMEVFDWDGYADSLKLGPLVRFPTGRDLRRRVVGIEEVAEDAASWGRIPMCWQASDRAWAVGADLYARSVVINCSAACANDLLAELHLESFQVFAHDILAPED